MSHKQNQRNREKDKNHSPYSQHRRQIYEEPNFRSVGAKPCNFNKLKYTTSYRTFGRKSLPNLLPLKDLQAPKQQHYQDQNLNQNSQQNTQNLQKQKKQSLKQKQRQLLNLQFKLNFSQKKLNQFERQKQLSKKKLNKMIDKWKQKYSNKNNNEVPNLRSENNSINKKDVQYFPQIHSHPSSPSPPVMLLSTRQNFHDRQHLHELAQKKLSKKKQHYQPENDPQKMSQQRIEEIFQKYEPIWKDQALPSEQQDYSFANKKYKIKINMGYEEESSLSRRMRYSLQIQQKINNIVRYKMDRNSTSVTNSNTNLSNRINDMENNPKQPSKASVKILEPIKNINREGAMQKSTMPSGDKLQNETAPSSSIIQTKKQVNADSTISNENKQNINTISDDNVGKKMKNVSNSVINTGTSNAVSRQGLHKIQQKGVQQQLQHKQNNVRKNSKQLHKQVQYQVPDRWEFRTNNQLQTFIQDEQLRQIQDMHRDTLARQETYQHVIDTSSVL